MNESFSELNRLLAEVRTAGLETKLRLFIANKEFEMQVSFGKIAQEHCNKLIGLFKVETDQAREALSLSCVIAQDQYLLMRANHVDQDRQLTEQQDELLTMLENRVGVVRFNDDQLEDTISQLMDLSEEADGVISTQQGGEGGGQRASYNVAEVLSAMAATRKRRNLVFVDGGEGEEAKSGTSHPVKVPRTVVPVSSTAGAGPLDQTVVVLPTTRGGMGSGSSGGIDGVEPLVGNTEDVFNGTFQMPVPSLGRSGHPLNETVNIVTTSVLKEQSLNKIMSQPALMTRMAKVTKGGGTGGSSGGRVGDNAMRLMKKTSAGGVTDHGVCGRSSPNRVAKARLAASRAGVAALKSKAGSVIGGGIGGGGGGVGGGSANKKRK